MREPSHSFEHALVRKRGKWTTEKRELAYAMRRAGNIAQDIADAVGMSRSAVETLVSALERPKQPKTIKESTRRKAHPTNAGSYVTVSENALQQRDRLKAAREARDEVELARGNISPIFFGDPPPGYSALDKKRARA